MRRLRIHFDAIGSPEIGSYRIPFIGIRSIMEEMEEVYVCKDIDQDFPDVVVCLGGQGRAKINRKKYPKSFIVLFKPHKENVLSFSLYQMPLISVKNLIYFMKNILSNDVNYEDRQYSDCLIADSRRLALHYRANHYNTYYFRLMENIGDSGNKSLHPPSHGEELNIMFHGSVTHFNEAADTFKVILESLAFKYRVNFFCVMGLKERYKDIGIEGVTVHYIEYDFDRLINLLPSMHLGLVTNFVKHRKFFDNLIGSFLLFGKYQSALEILSQKFSSNAGRSYLFAHFGVPFISHPIYDALIDYSWVENIEFPVTNKEMIYYINDLLNSPYKYINLSGELLNFSKKHNLYNETSMFVKYLIDINNSKNINLKGD